MLPSQKAPSSEAVLSYAWKTLRFSRHALVTQCDQSVTLVRTGVPNPDAGPDFLQAEVRIGDTTWAGAVEIHLRGDDWYVHGHHTDPAYNVTVLHVVWQPSSKPPMRQDGTPVPELSLAHLIDNMLLEQAEALTHSPDELPCSGILTSVPDIFRTQWVEHCGWQRVLHNVKELESELAALRYNWLQLTWEKLAGTMGGPANKEAMQRLARKVPFAVVGTHLSDAETLEGILFGAANLLPSPSSDPYVTKLTSAWKHYSLKHRIEPLPLGSFKFGRMRPHSFPTLRIAQLVSLLGSGTALMQLIAQPSELARILPNLAVSPFWEIHYTFADTPRYTPKTIGKSFADGLLINCFMPLSVLYHTILGKDSVMENTLEVLNGLAPEDNSVVRQMKQAGFDAKTALDTQGLLHLYRNWCTPRNCLDCGIGHKLLSSNLLATKR